MGGVLSVRRRQHSGQKLLSDYSPFPPPQEAILGSKKAHVYFSKKTPNTMIPERCTVPTPPPFARHPWQSPSSQSSPLAHPRCALGTMAGP